MSTFLSTFNYFSLPQNSFKISFPSINNIWEKIIKNGYITCHLTLINVFLTVLYAFWIIIKTYCPQLHFVYNFCEMLFSAFIFITQNNKFLKWCTCSSFFLFHFLYVVSNSTMHCIVTSQLLLHDVIVIIQGTLEAAFGICLSIFRYLPQPS